MSISQNNISSTLKKIQKILFSYKNIKEIKNKKQLSYYDEYGAVVVLRKKEDKLVIAFARGALMQNKFPSLQGAGKIVRHMQIQENEQIDITLFKKMLYESFLLGLEADEMKKLKKQLLKQKHHL